jgi:O-succinylbenzoate synthase
MPSGATAWARRRIYGAELHPETIDNRLARRSGMARPRLLGRSLSNAAAVHELRREYPRAQHGEGGARNGMLGARGGSARFIVVAAARDAARVPTGVSLGISPPALLVERAVAASPAGYNKIKLKIQPDRTSSMCAVRAALGRNVEIMADANAAYTADDIDHLVELDAFGLLMLEQPLGADDLLALAELQRRMSTSICLDESITDVKRARAT